MNIIRLLISTINYFMMLAPVDVLFLFLLLLWYQDLNYDSVPVNALICITLFFLALGTINKFY